MPPKLVHDAEMLGLLLLLSDDEMKRKRLTFSFFILNKYKKQQSVLTINTYAPRLTMNLNTYTYTASKKID